MQHFLRSMSLPPLALLAGFANARAQCAEWDDRFAYAGLAGQVDACATFDDGSGSALYVGGEFGMAGALEVNRVARWDGATWSALGSGVNGPVKDLIVFDDGTGAALYAAGDFST